MDSVKIHMPLSDGILTQVRVNPDKSYNGISGNELISRYSKRRRKPKTPTKTIQSINWESERWHNLTVNTGHTIAKGKATEVFKLDWIPHSIRTTYNLKLPCGEFSKRVRVGGADYDPRLICQIIEDITHQKIICRRGDRPLKRHFNTSYDINIIYEPDAFKPLLIVGKGNIIYILSPMAEDC